MTPHLDARETRDPRQRELDVMGHLPGLIAKALKSPAWRQHLGEVDPTHVNTRAALARLPPDVQQQHHPGRARADETCRAVADPGIEQAAAQAAGRRHRADEQIVEALRPRPLAGQELTGQQRTAAHVAEVPPQAEHQQRQA